MTALGLTSLIYLACLILSGLIFWSCRIGNLAGFANAKRTVLAMHRAAEAGLLKSARSSSIPLIAVAGLWCMARVFSTRSPSTSRPIVTAAYAVLAAIIGALSATLLAHVAVHWARISALRVIAAALTSADRLLVTVFRSSAALALLVESVGFAFALGIAALCWATKSESVASGIPDAHVLLSATQVLSDFTMGAILVTLTMQSSGTTYRMCSRTGSTVASHDANLGDHDPRNPSAIADAAGLQLGQLVPTTLDAFCSSLCGNVLLLFLLWCLRTDNASALPASYLFLPLVLRGFGALATVFAMASVRTMESLNPASALLRSQAVFVVIVLGAIGGGCTWLVPEQLTRLALCGVAGFLLPLAVSHWQNFVVNRAVQRTKSPRPTSDGIWAEGLVVGLLGLAVPLLLLLAVLFGVLKSGASAGLGHGRWLALMVCYLGMGIAMPFCITIDAARPLVALSRRAVHLIDSLRVDDGQRRLARLEEAAYSPTAHAISTQTQAAAGMPLLAALTLGILAKVPNSGAAGTEAISTLYLCPLALLVPLALILQASLRSSKAISNEVRRQLSGFPQEAGVFRVPSDFTPSYRNCVDIASRESTRNLGIPSVALVAIPLAAGAIVCWWLRDTEPTGQALALYVGVVAVTVSVVGFILEAANDFANKAGTRTLRGINSQQSMTVGDAVHHLAIHAPPTIRLLAKATAIVALTYSPYVL